MNADLPLMKNKKIRRPQVRFDRFLHPARARGQSARFMTPAIESDMPMLRSYTQQKLRIATNLRGLCDIL